MTRAVDQPPLDWLIVGGGIHGVHVALRLLVDGGVRRDRLRIVDPGDRLLSRWRACTEVTGMTYLRSPVVHNIGPAANSLLRFAGRLEGDPAGLFAPPYRRPLLSLFNAHCERLIESMGLGELHVRERVEDCSVADDRISLQLSSGRRLVAGHVVLALGASEEPHWPHWTGSEDPHVHHVFAPGFRGWPCPGEPEDVAVVGGGITGAQVAVRLGAQGHRVQLVSRHAVRKHQFDSDPGWLGPKYMASFQRTRDLARRRAMIDEARNRGSLPPDVARALSHSRARGEVRWHEAEVKELAQDGSTLQLRLWSGVHLAVDRVLLATGHTTRRPGGALIDRLIDSASLPRASCGYPVVDRALRWHPRIHVTGPLAELELGPSARTIAGAQRAGERILDALQRERFDAVSADAS